MPVSETEEAIQTMADELLSNILDDNDAGPSILSECEAHVVADLGFDVPFTFDEDSLEMQLFHEVLNSMLTKVLITAATKLRYFPGK